VTEITPPPTKLGLFRLEPSAGCGDLISAPVRVDGEFEKSEQTFVIKRVAYRYEYQGGAYRMTGKRADVKKASRDAAEAFFERMLPKDEDMSALDGRRPERSRCADDANSGDRL